MDEELFDEHKETRRAALSGDLGSPSDTWGRWLAAMTTETHKYVAEEQADEILSGEAGGVSAGEMGDLTESAHDAPLEAVTRPCYEHDVPRLTRAQLAQITTLPQYSSRVASQRMSRHRARRLLGYGLTYLAHLADLLVFLRTHCVRWIAQTEQSLRSICSTFVTLLQSRGVQGFERAKQAIVGSGIHLWAQCSTFVRTCLMFVLPLMGRGLPTHTYHAQVDSQASRKRAHALGTDGHVAGTNAVSDRIGFRLRKLFEEAETPQGGTPHVVILNACRSSQEAQENSWRQTVTAENVRALREWQLHEQQFARNMSLMLARPRGGPLQRYHYPLEHWLSRVADTLLLLDNLVFLLGVRRYQFTNW